MPSTESLHQLEKIEGAFTRHRDELSNLKSPTEVYEEKAAEIRERIRLSWASLDSTLGSETSKIRDDIVDSGGELRELKIEHETGVQDEEEAYNKAVRQITDTLCSELLDLIGPAKITSWLRNASSEVRKVVVLDLDVEQSPLSSTIICAGNKRKTASPKTPKTKVMKLSQIERNDHDSTRGKPYTSSSDARSSRRRTRPSHRRHGDIVSAFDEEFEGVTEPDAGNIYLAFWERSKDWFAVLLLPMENLLSVGIPGSIESLGLADSRPKCYCSKRGSVSWAGGYGDGEFLVAEREFPVMYFDGQEFPTKSDVGWVSARNLRPFDANSKNTLIPHIKSVRKFLERREGDLSKNKVEEPENEMPRTTDQLLTGGNHKKSGSLKVPRLPYQTQESHLDLEQEPFEPPPLTQTESSSMDCEAIFWSNRKLQSPANLHNRQDQQHRLDTNGSAAPNDNNRKLKEHVGSPDSRNIAHLNTADANSLEPPKAFETGKGFRDIIWTPVITPKDSCFTLPAPDQHDTLANHSAGVDSPSLSSPKTSLPVPVLSASQKVQQWQLTQYNAGDSSTDRLNTDEMHSGADDEQQRHHEHDVIKRHDFNPYGVADMQYSSSVPCNTYHSCSGQKSALFRSSASGTTSRSLPISSLLQQETNSHQPYVTPSLGPVQSVQQSSLHSTSVWTTAKPTLQPPPSLPLHFGIFTTTLTAGSPATAPQVAGHSHNSFSQRRLHDPFRARAASSSNAATGIQLAYPPGPIPGLQERWSRDSSQSPEVMRGNNGWYQDLPQDLIECLERYQHHNDLGFGVDGFRLQRLWYMCPFCNESIRKPYTRPKPFSNHLKWHWATKTVGKPLMYKIHSGIW